MKCTVIIPFGPGHNELALRAKNSVEEAISEGTGAFHEVTILLMDDSDGKLGRSKARNSAVAKASTSGADWIFFLDADDLMAANAFNVAQQYINDYDALWGAIYEADIAKQVANERPNQITPITSLEQILINDPYLTLQMGHFVKTKTAIKTPFDESLDCGEDVDYYLKVWKENRCLKIDKPLFFNVRGQHSTGPRSATGQDWRNSIIRIYEKFCAENDVITKINFNGKTIAYKLTNTLDLIQNQLARENFFELNELIETLSIIPKNPRILDVGSNIGNHALFFTILSESQEIHCFEPSTTNAESLQKNFEINQVDPHHYTIHRLAIGAKSQRGTLCRPDNLNSGATSVKIANNGTIQIESLDSILAENSTFDLLKIDVEGMELEVLAGGKRTIKNGRPIILIEVSNQNKPAFFCWCEKNNYRIAHTFELVHASNYLLVSNTSKEKPRLRPAAYTKSRKTKVPLAPHQSELGWCLHEFILGYTQKKAIEVILLEKNQYAIIDITTKNKNQSNERELIKLLNAPVLINESLKKISDNELSTLLKLITHSGQDIIIFAIMDSRWDNPLSEDCHFRDAEQYIIEGQRYGYTLTNYLKLPYKAAHELSYQLDSRATLLHMKKTNPN